MTIGKIRLAPVFKRTLFSQLLEIASKKSADPDIIPDAFLKMCGNEFLVICLLFLGCHRHGIAVLTAGVRRGFVKVIFSFKSSAKHSVNYYRPIFYVHVF